ATGKNLRYLVPSHEASDALTVELAVFSGRLHIPSQAVVERQIRGCTPTVLRVGVILPRPGVGKSIRGLLVDVGNAQQEVDAGITRAIGAGALVIKGAAI